MSASQPELPLENAIRRFLEARGTATCLLLVTPDVVRLESVAVHVAAAHGWPGLSVGADLSEALLREPPAAYPRVASAWLEQRTIELGPDPVLLTEIDLLFEPALRLDP